MPAELAIRSGLPIPTAPPQPTDVWPHMWGLVTTPPLVDRHGRLDYQEEGSSDG